MLTWFEVQKYQKYDEKHQNSIKHLYAVWKKQERQRLGYSTLLTALQFRDVAGCNNPGKQRSEIEV